LDSWDSQLVKSDHEHRLTLLYLANDVVQNCRKKYPDLLGQWQNRIENAFEHLTHHAIRSGVEKVINVWDTRTVFDKESIEKMKTVLATAKANHKDKGERALKDFKPNDLVDALKEYTSCENDLRMKQELLNSSGLNETDPDKLLEKVKERGKGERARQELQQWTQLLIEYVDLQEIHIERRRKLLSLINQSCIFYQAQFHEVSVVLKAYKDYQERVLAQKKRCQEMMQQKFPTLFPNISPIQSPVQSPVPSPDRDQIDMKISDEDTANSSEDEQVENTLEAFFGPSSIQSNPTSSTKPNLTSLPVGSVAAEGDLDSRLANIFTPEEKKRKTSRWDTEAPAVVPPPPPPKQMGWQDGHPNNWNEQGGKWPNMQGWEQNSPNQGGPRPRFGSPGGRGNFSPRIRGGPDYRGGRGGPRGGFQPRTPQNYPRPPPQFNSEGNNRFGGYRGRGNFSQRGARGMGRGGHGRGGQW